MRTALVLALLSALVVLLLLPASSWALVQPTSAEKSVLRLVNRERAKRGLKSVKLEASLVRAARAHARHQALRGVLTHRSANGDGVGRRLVRYGYRRSGFRLWSVGENVARARSGSLPATPTGAVCLWMGSKIHRRVILGRNVRDVGIGIFRSGGQRFFTLDVGRRIR